MTRLNRVIMIPRTRTTLTLDDDVARLVEDAVHRERRPMKQVVNGRPPTCAGFAAIRGEPYHLTPHESAVRPGFDIGGFNKLVGELEDESIIGNARRSS